MAHLRTKEASVWGASPCRTRGQLPPTLLGFWRVGPVLSYFAFEERVAFKPKGKPVWLPPLSIAFALKGWDYLVHPLPGKSQGLEKCLPVWATASANIAHPAREVCLGPDSSIVSLNTVGLSKGVETGPGIFVGLSAKGLPPPTPTQHPHMGSPSRLRLLEMSCEGLCGAQCAIWSRREAAQAGPPLGDSRGQNQEGTNLMQRKVDKHKQWLFKAPGALCKIRAKSQRVTEPCDGRSRD